MKFHLERGLKKGKLYYAYKASYREKGKVKSKRVYLGPEERASKILSDFNSKKPDKEYLYSYTGELLLNEVSKRLLFSNIVEKHVNNKSKWDIGQFLETITIERCLNPVSKWALAQRYHNRSILSLQGSIPSSAFTESNIYNYMDYIAPKIHQIQADIVKQVYKLFPAMDEVLILDGTSFTVTAEDNEQDIDEQEEGGEIEEREEKKTISVENQQNKTQSPEIEKKSISRKYGYSRSKRPDLPQINLMLGVNKNYIPLYFEVFAGNTVDLKMFEITLQRLKQTYQGLLQRMQKKYLIFDRGNLSPSTALQLDQLCDEWQFDFISGIKSSFLKEELAALDIKDLPFIFQNKETELFGITIDKKIYNKTRKVLLYVSKAVRKHKLLKFEEKLERVQKDLSEIASKTTRSSAQKVTEMKSILRKNGIVRLFWVQKFDKDGIAIPSSYPPSALYQLLPQKVEAKKALFGKFVVISSDLKLTAPEIISYYKTKETVEHEFHILKSLHAINPIYHRIPQRMDTHTAIVCWGMLFLAVLRSFLEQNGYNYSFEELLFVIKQGYLQQAIYNYPGFKSFKLTRLINITPELEEIMNYMKIKTQHFHIEDFRLQSQQKKTKEKG